MDCRRVWKDTVEQLKQIRKDDREFVDAGFDPDRDHARTIAAGLYVRYIGLNNILCPSISLTVYLFTIRYDSLNLF